MKLIIGAMDVEVQELLKLTDKFEKIEYKGIIHYRAILANEEVIIAQSGVGKVNATYTTTLLSMYYTPDFIINIGSAGGLLANQHVGDIVIANSLAQHDVFIGPETFSDKRFKATVAQEYESTLRTVLDAHNLNSHVGLIVSGDQFVVKDSLSYKTIKKELSEAIAVEMEATAIATVANFMDIPIIILRALSDIAVKEGNEQTFEEFVAHASKYSAKITYEFIKTLSI